MTRYHMTVVFENINELQRFCKAMLAQDIDTSIIKGQMDLVKLNGEIEETTSKLDNLKILIPKDTTPKKEERGEIKQSLHTETPQIIL